MRPTILAPTDVAELASAGFSIVGSRSRPAGMPDLAEMAENAAAFSDAGIAALRAGLRLTPGQELLWPPVEQALRELARQRIERRIASLTADRTSRGGAGSRDDRSERLKRLRRCAGGLTARGDALLKLVDAADPLFASLNAAQARRFEVLFEAIQRNRFTDWDGGAARNCARSAPSREDPVRTRGDHGE